MDYTLLKVGLTGGIACGKTTVSNLFASLGVPVIDADTIAHRLTQSGQPMLATIVEKFGRAFLTVNGHLNRALLRQVTLDSIDRRKQLEMLLHPAVYAAIEDKTRQLNSPYCVLSIPLLLETKQLTRVQRVLVVDSCRTVQYTRLLKRGLSATEIQGFILAQVSRKERLSAADDIIFNSYCEMKNLKNTVLTLHKKYMKLSSQLNK